MANRAYCIALKPCQLAGRKFLIGERVPGDLLDEKSAARMRQMGYLSKCVLEAESVQPQEDAPAVPNAEGQQPNNPVEPGDNPPQEITPEKPTKPKK